MAGALGEHDFLGLDGVSDDETFDTFGEHDSTEGLLQHCDSIDINHDMTLLQPLEDDSLGGQSLEVYEGMSFPSLDDARDFYYEYAKHTGFTIRTNRIRHSLKNTAIIGRDFVCSREGFRSAKHTLRKDRVLPPRPVTREGCKAMIRLAARDGGKWVVTKFVREHNHKLMANCNVPGELPIVNILSEEEKDKRIQDLHEELEREKERSASFQQQLCMVLKDLEEHSEFMSIRVEEIVNNLKDIELDAL